MFRVFGWIGLAALLAGGPLAGAAGAQEGTYLRKGKELIELRVQDGRLFCTRQSDGFEMCHGMIRGEDGSWRGRQMRHPAMKFMKFNGTVTFTGDGLKIQGCALGICRAETWVKQ